MTELTVEKQLQYKIADISLAEWGRKEIDIAEKEMPGLMSIREKYSVTKPLQGVRIMGSLHMTIQTAVLIETLEALGADVRWASCNIFSTQDHAAAAIAERNIPVFAWKGETLEEYWWCTKQALSFPDGKGPQLIVDDGGDATLLIHKGFAAENDSTTLDVVADSVEEAEVLRVLKETLAEDPTKWHRVAEDWKGVSEETTTGVHRLYQMKEAGELLIPAINVNDSVTKSKNDNKYGCRHSLNDAIKRGTDMLMSGKKALVIGYGDVGKGSAQSLRQEGMIVKISEIDPICAMQACMDGFEIVSPYKQGNNTGKTDDINKRLLATTDLIVTTTGNFNVCDDAMLQTLKAGSVVCNIGHFDNEIDTQYMRDNWRWDEVKPQVHRVFRSDDKSDYLILLSEGRLVNLGNATGHPSRIMDGSFANQVLAQMHLFDAKFADLGGDIYVEVLPKKLDEEVAAGMVGGFGGVLTTLTDAQADYINVKKEGPFKPESYKY